MLYAHTCTSMTELYNIQCFFSCTGSESVKSRCVTYLSNLSLCSKKEKGCNDEKRGRLGDPVSELG